MNLLYVCYGNICRSPFAEKFTKQMVGPEHTIKSAGFHEREGRKSPITAKKVASEFGVSLWHHKSKVINQELVDWADKIIVMDQYHTAELDNLFGVIPNSVDYLLDYHPSIGGGLDDPYDKGYDKFQDCYQKIADSVPNIVEELE